MGGRRRVLKPAAMGLVLASGLLSLTGCLRVGYDALERRDGGSSSAPDKPPLDAGPNAPRDAAMDGGPSTPGDGSRPDGSTGGADGSIDSMDASAGITDGSTSSDASDAAGMDAGDGGTFGEDVVEAEGKVHPGAFLFSGAGCSASNATADPTDRPLSRSLNFQAFSVHADSGSFETTACSVALELTVEAGVSLRMVGGSWQGDYTVSASGTATVATSYSFDSESGRSASHMLPIVEGTTFMFEDDVRDPANTSAGWTACNAAANAVTARATLSISASDNITVAIRQGSVFRLESRDCEP